MSSFALSALRFGASIRSTSFESFRLIQLRLASVKRSELDFSKLPHIEERDLEEKFTHGSGPGGQNVNKQTNCVFLRHLPTGIIVKCHQERELHRNREIARQMLIEKLDEHLNGDQSVDAQRTRLLKAKSDKEKSRLDKRREAKRKYQELLLKSKREVKNVDDSSLGSG